MCFYSYCIKKQTLKWWQHKSVKNEWSLARIKMYKYKMNFFHIVESIIVISKENIDVEFILSVFFSYISFWTFTL